MEYIFLNDDLIEKDKAFLHVSDLSIHRGYGIFDFFKLKDFQNPWLEKYLDRFYNSLAYAGISCQYSRSELKEMIIKVFKKNRLSTGYIKIVCTGGYSPDGYSPPEKSNLMIYSFPINKFPIKPEGKGYNLIADDYIRVNPLVKSTNYFNSVMHYPRIKQYDAADVLYHKNGYISECSRCNVFVVKDRKIATPESGILEGITRGRVLDLVDKGFEITVRPVNTLEIFTADEIFITSSTKGIMPIINIEGRKVNTGHVGQMCKELSPYMEVF